MLYPIFVNLDNRDVLVVGGGAVAARKVSGLLGSGARVTVVAPRICAELEQMERRDGVKILRRRYQPADLEAKWLIIVATSDGALNRAVSQDAARARVFCNVVDRPAACSFQVPAVVRRGLLQIAVSTGGASPAMARRIRVELERSYGTAHAELLDAMLDLRAHFQRKYPDDQARRRRLLESFLDSEAVECLIKNGDREGFTVELERWKSL